LVVSGSKQAFAKSGKGMDIGRLIDRKRPECRRGSPREEALPKPLVPARRA
jgi:hypothetical protein